MFWPFHQHNWKIVSAYCDGFAHYVARASGHFGVTHVALRCTKCGKLREKEMLGIHTLEALNGNADEVSRALADIEKASR